MNKPINRSNHDTNSGTVRLHRAWRAFAQILIVVGHLSCRACHASLSPKGLELLALGIKRHDADAMNKPKPETRNPKPYALNPTPQTLQKQLLHRDGCLARMPKKRCPNLREFSGGLSLSRIFVGSMGLWGLQVPPLTLLAAS